MKKYTESITALEIEILGIQIRVWRKEAIFSDEASTQTQNELSIVLSKYLKAKQPQTRGDIANALFEVDRVNAVEVKNSFGNGVVLYKNWP